jgi:hypothetical protein
MRHNAQFLFEFFDEAWSRRSWYYCDGCGISFDYVHVWRAPMVNNSTWRKIAHPDQILCANCFFARVRERRVDLSHADLR